jgi:hypothetical protein
VVIELANAKGIGFKRSRSRNILKVPWHKTPSKRRHEILVPGSVPPQDACAMRSENRALLISSIVRGRPVGLSNNIIQKGLAFGRDWSGTVVNLERVRAPRSCPAGSMAEVGLWWCGATPPSTETEDLDVNVCEEAITAASTHGNDCRKPVAAGNGQSPSAA